MKVMLFRLMVRIHLAMHNALNGLFLRYKVVQNGQNYCFCGQFYLRSSPINKFDQKPAGMINIFITNAVML